MEVTARRIILTLFSCGLRQDGEGTITDRMGQDGMSRVGTDRVGVGWVGMGRVGMGQDQMGWLGVDWGVIGEVGLGGVAIESIKQALPGARRHSPHTQASSASPPARRVFGRSGLSAE